MKKTLLSIALSATVATSAFVSTQASAVEGLSANIGATSNYLWRGITQSGDDSAISGGIDYAAESGFYAGTWASSLGGGTTEVDLYAGYGFESNGISYDFGYIFYGYDQSQGSNGDSDFGEIYASVGIDAFSFGVSILAHAEWDEDFADDVYYTADYALDIDGLEVGFHAGYYDTETDYDAGNIYDGYDLGVSASKNGFTFGVNKHENTNTSVYVSYAVDFDL
ncbi:TorF family putative porin [Colwellia sp. UCD-KL20]|uniref:TorF family putative porin n=1 Tax=Colwellia sp. UCD-KL20 TaxID=1917165 RepID=UPI000970AAB2|nr:TorF family putative porin [Colwellia sp. UCD-KL20]